MTRILFLFILILIDQLSKYIVRSSGGFYICNPNIAFGIKVNTVLFYVLWFLIIAFVVILANSKFKTLNPKQSQNSNASNSKRFWILDFDTLNLFRICNLGFSILNARNLGIILILSGAISNIIDRLLYGCVIDFIDPKFWPVFNLADSFIVLGVIIVLVKTQSTKAQNTISKTQ